MRRSARFVTPWACIAVTTLVSACAGRVAPATTPVQAAQPAPPVAVAPPPVVAPVRDLVAELIAASSVHFAAGQRELQLGHLDSAKVSFNKALETLLDSPTGARGEPRIREQFDMLVERISAYEVMALAQGDGFTEKKSEPAAIDALLAETTFADPPATRETTAAVTQDLETTTHDIDIPLNPRVLAFVEAFSGRLKGYLEEGLGRAARYLPMIQDVFRAEGLPLDLAYVPLIESAFKPNALSRAKAKGLWQFMSGTGRENGLQQDWYVDERSEPEKATRAAAKYLKSLYGTFNDWHLALASYNGGPGRVQRALNRSGRDDFWELSSSTKFLPRETRDYVPLILAAVIVAKNPAQYGLSIVPLEAPPSETITLPKAADLRRIAEWGDTSVELLQELNPELRRWTTPVKANDYRLRVPMGTAESVLARLTESVEDDLANLSWYTVKKGETLLGIARKLRVNRADLAEANYLSAKARVNSGQQLIIPRAPATLLAVRGDGPASDKPAVQAAVAVRSAEASPTLYRVKQGDTLYAIARLFDVSVASIRTWNSLRSTAIQVGQRLRIHPSAASATR
ncbi:MAG: LysM peptidoglycan-binding domain-containing protein [Vicinamibacterales bacterium]